jgi:hypothetical protein
VRGVARNRKPAEGSYYEDLLVVRVHDLIPPVQRLTCFLAHHPCQPQVASGLLEISKRLANSELWYGTDMPFMLR